MLKRTHDAAQKAAARRAAVNAASKRSQQRARAGRAIGQGRVWAGQFITLLLKLGLLDEDESRRKSRAAANAAATVLVDQLENRALVVG